LNENSHEDPALSVQGLGEYIMQHYLSFISSLN